MDLYTDILLLPNSINIPPQVPNSADTPTKLNAPANVELNHCNRSTFLPADIPTKLHTQIGVNLTTVGVNLTIIADQHSSPGTKLDQHTYQTKRTDQCWT